MNPLSIVFGVVAFVAVASAQEGSCGCAPQPTVIQLSCGGNNQPSHPPPPPPPPAFGPAPPAWAPAPSADGIPYPPTNMEEYELSCKFDDNGYPISNPPGGFPEGFRLIEHADGSIEPVGFHPHQFGGQMPPPGTPQFNMIMCTHIAVPVI